MSFRLKCKKYVINGREYLASLALMQSTFGQATVFLMRDEETISVVMSVDEYNAIPYRWFEDVGPAPKGTAVEPTDLRRPS